MDLKPSKASECNKIPQPLRVFLSRCAVQQVGFGPSIQDSRGKMGKTKTLKNVYMNIPKVTKTQNPGF